MTVSNRNLHLNSDSLSYMKETLHT